MHCSRIGFLLSFCFRLLRVEQAREDNTSVNQANSSKNNARKMLQSVKVMKIIREQC